MISLREILKLVFQFSQCKARDVVVICVIKRPSVHHARRQQQKQRVERLQLQFSFTPLNIGSAIITSRLLFKG